MSSANLSLRTAIKLTRSSDLPTWPSHLDAPQHIGYDLDAGSLSLTVSFSNGQDITVRDTGDGLDATGPYMERLFAEDMDAYYRVAEWAEDTYRMTDSLLYTVQLEASFAPGVHDTVTALALGRPAPQVAPGPATDERGILTEAEIVNAMSNESPILYAQDEDTVRDGRVRRGRWSADGRPAQGKSIHDAHVRITLSTGMDAFKPFTTLVHMLQTGQACIRDRD